MALGQVVVQRQLVTPRGMPRDPAQFARYRTQMRERPEDIWQALYDRVNYPAAGVAGDLGFFATPLGGSTTLILKTGARAAAALTKSKSFPDTNLPKQGGLPANAFPIHGFSAPYIRRLHRAPRPVARHCRPREDGAERRRRHRFHARASCARCRRRRGPPPRARRPAGRPGRSIFTTRPTSPAPKRSPPARSTARRRSRRSTTFRSRSARTPLSPGPTPRPLPPRTT